MAAQRVGVYALCMLAVGWKAQTVGSDIGLYSLMLPKALQGCVVSSGFMINSLNS